MEGLKDTKGPKAILYCILLGYLNITVRQLAADFPSFDFLEIMAEQSELPSFSNKPFISSFTNIFKHYMTRNNEWVELIPVALGFDSSGAFFDHLCNVSYYPGLVKSILSKLPDYLHTSTHRDHIIRAIIYVAKSPDDMVDIFQAYPSSGIPFFFFALFGVLFIYLFSN